MIDDKHAKRADFISITGNPIFIVSFCTTGIKVVANKTVRICPDIVIVIQKWKKLPSSNWLRNKNYATNVSAVNFKLTTSKLRFFNVIIFLLKLLLNVFGSGYPLVSLVYGDVLGLVNYLRNNKTKCCFWMTSKGTADFRFLKEEKIIVAFFIQYCFHLYLPILA